MTEPLTKTSSVGTGAKAVEFAIGPGEYILMQASISTDQPYLQACRIGNLYTRGDGSTVNCLIDTGFTHQNMPFCLKRSVKVLGPGTIIGTVYMHESDDWRMAVQYEKVVY